MPTSLSMPSALSHPLPSISPSSPSGSGKIPRALQVPAMGTSKLFSTFFFPSPSPGPTKLSRLPVPSARVAALTCPREKGAPTIATEWTDLVRTQGICPWRRRETLLLRNMIGREGLTLGVAAQCNSGPRMSAASHSFAASPGERALRPVTSASLGHAPNQPLVHLLGGPQLARVWDTPAVESPVDVSSLSLDTPPMPKPRG